MLMIIAVNDDALEEKLTKEYKNRYELLIIKAKDALMALKNEYEESILVLKDDIPGIVSTESIIKYIKTINDSARILLITQKLTKEYKEFLFSKEVFNIIEGCKIKFDSLVECINNPKMVIYKTEEDKKNNNVIFVTGARNSGKTICSLNMANYIAKRCKDKKIVLIDLDFQNPSIHLYINNQKNYSLKDLINDFEKENIKARVNYESEDDKINNLVYILNNIQMNQPDSKQIFLLIDMLSTVYDYVIADTSSYFMNRLYKQKKYVIVHVIKDNLKGIKDYYSDTLNLEKNKNVKLLFNCKRKRKNRGNINVNSYIRKNFYLIFLDKYKYIDRFCNISKIVKEIGILKLEKLKKKLINKILEIGDD